MPTQKNDNACFEAYLYSAGYTTREPGVCHSHHMKNSGEVLEKMQVNVPGRYKEEIPGSRRGMHDDIRTCSKL